MTTPTEPTEPITPPDVTPPVETPTEPETFTKEYVEGLRREAAEHRTRAAGADTAREGWTREVARRTGRLADPRDLPITADLLGEDGTPDEAKVGAAIDALLVERPHLAARKVIGDVGQGQQSAPVEVGILGTLKGLV